MNILTIMLPVSLLSRSSQKLGYTVLQLIHYGRIPIDEVATKFQLMARPSQCSNVHVSPAHVPTNTLFTISIHSLCSEAH